MSTFPYIFTFYSYKGGVGRSMALLNAAYALVHRGRHVLMVDFDLEAPGVSGFLERNGELDKAPPDASKNVVDLLFDLRAAERLSDVPPIDAYRRSILPTKLEGFSPKLGKLGRLDAIVAGLSSDYWKRLTTLNLASLDQHKLLELSAKLWKYVKAQRFPFQPHGLSTEPPEATPYDYVLVDSRTGMTDVGGLCVGPLADRLVVVTGLNDQNVNGTLDFLKEAGIDPKRRMAGDEAWDEADPVGGEADQKTDDDEASLGLGPKPTLIVASPLPPGEIAFKEKRLGEIREKLGDVSVTLSYHPQMALMETLFVRDHPAEYLAREYEDLTAKLMAQVRDDAAHLLTSPEAPVTTRTLEKALRLASADPRMGAHALMQQADAFSPKTDEDYRLARRAHATLAQLGGSVTLTALFGWGNALVAEAGTKEGDEATRLRGEAIVKYEAVLAYKPNHHVVLFNWGNALADEARTKAGDEAARLRGKAIAKYEASLAINPDQHEALNNWGTALADEAKTKVGDEATRLRGEAIAKYEAALAIKPDDQRMRGALEALRSQAAEVVAREEEGKNSG